MAADTFFPREVLQEHPSQCCECGRQVRAIFVGKTATDRTWITVEPTLVKLISSHVFKRHACPKKFTQPLAKAPWAKDARQ